MDWNKLSIRKKSVIIFYISGLLAFIWFLIRVIPKPSRATYPCQRAAFPITSAFIIHLSGILAGSLIFRRAVRLIEDRRLTSLSLIFAALILMVITGLSTGIKDLRAERGAEQYAEIANKPLGIAKGVIPGRVIWVWNPEAVNEDCPNTWLESDNWWMEQNTDRTKVHGMLESSLCLLTGSQDATDAWDQLFKYYNRERGKGTYGYLAGEKVCIKSNFVSCDASNMDGHNKKENLNMIDTSPQLMWSVLNQLSNVYGIPQTHIYIGDPSAYFPNQYYDLLKTDFPDVVFISLHDGAEGRTKIVSSEGQLLQFSDGSGGDYLPEQFAGADYMINISVAKHHGSAGFSQIAKNHYGSNMRNSASHMHSSLVEYKKEYGHYRHFVDLLGHKDLGGKTILNIGDFLWSGHNAWTTPVKYTIAPFSDDYPSSLLVSIDPLALESVGLDFIQTQSWNDQLATTAGVDDYLYQSADPDYWPEGLQYDPENDGTILESLGVFEHWNSDKDKQYSGNMGIPGGIELVMAMHHKKVVSPTDFNAQYHEDPGYVILSWSDLSDNEDAYLLERSENNGTDYLTIVQTGPDITSYEDHDVKSVQEYNYRIRTIAGVDTTIAATFSILTPPATGILDTRNTQDLFTLFPNPTSGEFFIDCAQNVIITQVTIIDMKGTIVKQLIPVNGGNGSSVAIPDPVLGQGNYFVRLETVDGIQLLNLTVLR